MTATIKTKAELKEFFELGDRPSQSNFDDLITSVNLVNQSWLPVCASTVVSNPSTGYQALYFNSASTPANELYAKDSSGNSKRLSRTQIISGNIFVEAEETRILAKFPSRSCVITKLTVENTSTSGSSVNVIFKYGTESSSTLTSINTSAQTVGYALTQTTRTITLNNYTPSASSSLWVTTSSLTFTPTLSYCLEFYEA